MSMTRPTDLIPKELRDVLLRCYQVDPHWVRWDWDGGPPGPDGVGVYRVNIVPRLRDMFVRAFQMLGCRPQGTDLTGFKAMSVWLGQGPKTFRPTADQCRAFEHVDVNLPLGDYQQPYPAMMVQLPVGSFGPFTTVLCHHDLAGGPPGAALLCCSLFSIGNRNDIVTTVAQTAHDIESSLRRFDPEVGDADLTGHSVRALRVAVNSCLALANYGCQHSALYPHDVASDTRLAQESTERGHRARARLQAAPYVVTFKQEIKLHKEERCHRVTVAGDGEGGEGPLREVSTHWRRGHWAMQPHGAGFSLRKRIFRPPVLVRADRFEGDVADTSASYTG